MAWSGNVRILKIKLKNTDLRESWLNLVVCTCYYNAKAEITLLLCNNFTQEFVLDTLHIALHTLAAEMFVSLTGVICVL